MQSMQESENKKVLATLLERKGPVRRIALETPTRTRTSSYQGCSRDENKDAGEELCFDTDPKPERARDVGCLKLLKRRKVKGKQKSLWSRVSWPPNKRGDDVTKTRRMWCFSRATRSGAAI
jgi:hypothetical protein